MILFPIINIINFKIVKNWCYMAKQQNNVKKTKKSQLTFLQKIFSVKNQKCEEHIIKKKITILGISVSISVNKPKIVSKLLTIHILNGEKRKQKRSVIYEDLKYKTGTRKKEIDYIENRIKKHKYVYALGGILWNCPLHQRPHQRAKVIAKEKGLFLYLEIRNGNPILKTEGNIIFFNKDYLFHFSPKISRKIYLIVPNVEIFFSLEVCKKLRKRGINLIYDYIDDFSELIVHNNKPQLELFENLEQVDFCLFSATAKSLYNQLLSRFESERVILNPNGVNTDDFRADEPKILFPDMENVLKRGNNIPIVGYYGALAEWIDWELLNEVHKKRPQYNFVYIGVRYDKSSEKLEPAENVFILDEKPYKELYKYASFFDCCTIPFKNGDIAKATNPIKLFEYMSMKKATVCTKDLLECYGYDGVLIADGSDDFAAKLDEAIALGKDENIKNKLYSVALENTWRKRVLDLDEKIREIRNNS